MGKWKQKMRRKNSGELYSCCDDEDFDNDILTVVVPEQDRLKNILKESKNIEQNILLSKPSKIMHTNYNQKFWLTPEERIGLSDDFEKRDLILRSYDSHPNFENYEEEDLKDLLRIKEENEKDKRRKLIKINNLETRNVREHMNNFRRIENRELYKNDGIRKKEFKNYKRQTKEKNNERKRKKYNNIYYN